MRPSSDVLTVSRRICHDLRSPAGAILSLMELLEEGGDVVGHLEAMRGSTREILAILEQTSLILRASYSSRPPLEEVGMGHLVRMVLDRIRQLPVDRSVEWEVAEEWPGVRGVADWIFHVWHVLAMNAWRHGGSKIQLGWESSSTEWIFWVRDDGPGLSAGRSANPIPAFESLHSSRGSKGLGLPLARRLVELMHGRLVYRRRASGVTEFSFSLPREIGPLVGEGRGRLTDPARMGALRLTGLLRDVSVPALDEIANLAGRVVKRAMILISVVDDQREYFRGRANVKGVWERVQEVGLDEWVGRHVVETREMLVVEDAGKQGLGSDRAAREGMSMGGYLGVPVCSPEGEVLGALCAVSAEPRVWTEEEKEWLGSFSKLVTRELCLREEQGRLQEAFRTQREERALNDHLMEHSTDCIKVLDDEGCLLDMNGPGRVMMEIQDFSAVAGRDWLLRYPGDGMKGIRRALETARAGGTGRFQGVCPTLEGSVRWWDVSATAFLDGAGRTRYLVISRDLTKEKEVERRMMESEGRFRAMANQMSQFAWMADERGSIFWYNQRWLDYTGLSLEEMQGWGWQKVHHPDHLHRVLEKIRGCFDRGECWEDTFPLRGVDGQYRWFLSRAIPIRDDAGRVTRWFGTNTDVTEQLLVEEELRKASQAKDHFIAILSHELRTPLNPALLIASEAATRTDLPESVRKDFEVIRGSVSMEARLIDDLLDLTRLRHSKLALVTGVVSVDRVLADCVAEVREEARLKSVELKVVMEAVGVESEADELRLRQAFTNVLRNAVKFTPRGGLIGVESRVVRDVLEVVVTDTGIGMTEDEREKAFEPFEQGRHASAGGASVFGGLGLGLAISRTLIELHGGTVGLESRGRDLGTTVRISLPVKKSWPAAAVRPVGNVEAEMRRERPLRILVVEDHEATRQTMMRLLERRGHSVVTAPCCEEALERIQQRDFDVIFSDLGLPDGTGHELVKRLHEHQPGAVCVALSGYGMETDVKASLEAGFVMHLTKPVALENLVRAIRRVEEIRSRAGSGADFGQDIRAE